MSGPAVNVPGVTSAHAALTTHTCKFQGCPNEVKSAVGRYSYCGDHRDRTVRAQLLGQGGDVARAGAAAAGDYLRKLQQPPPAPKPAAKTGTMSERIARLAGQARHVDKLQERAVKLTSQALEAKRLADAARDELEQQLRAASQPDS